jgi:hypothetical protein
VSEAGSTPTPRAAWPLLLLGGLAFLPLAGVLFGFAAAVWGLVSDRPRAMLAAGLGAAGILLNFAGCGVLAWWGNQHSGGQITVAMAQADLKEVEAQLQDHRARYHHYPESLDELRVGPFHVPSPNRYDKTVGFFNRTRLYQYRPDADLRSYRLFAVGPDGEPDTPDDVYPAPPDSSPRAPAAASADSTP